MIENQAAQAPRHSAEAGPVLHTIGYEGLALDDLHALLAEERIRVVVDIRWTPISRKPGFSRSGLAETLPAWGVGYESARGLGSPPALRQDLLASGSWEAFALGYGRWLAWQEPTVQELAERVRDGNRMALLCVEADALRCHRSLVAAALLDRVDAVWVDGSRAGWRRMDGLDSGGAAR
ncbi:protein of unknown function [Candidatus Hydrogenisulfobacillus filiaventi]|uniref:DUF488 domain-containing protein n=1 Tax=Candidatus Hydrogenisulfobacillus filiaventi TaxID=2707344 RepID=A0A6F8ZHX0_9FIRM|nr:protein of unknown function [Candidatus Hydrogenisulfobacillus filiaventi]